jgi:hypothetical protein
MGCAGPDQEDEYVALPASSFGGLKAGLACSATFVAGRTLPDVIADELGGLPKAAAGTRDPVVDPASRSVRVAYAPDAPPRVAVYRPGAQVWLQEPIPAIFADRAYGGIGHRGQYVTIVPSHELVVVRKGLDPEEGAVLWRQDRLVADLIDAL